MLDTADRLDQFGDVLDRGLHHGARLGDFSDRGRGGRLHRLRGAGDAVIGGDHGLGGFLQLAEPVGLAGDTARNFLEVAGDVGKFDPEAADPVGKLVDQALAGRRRGLGVIQFRTLSCRHHGIPFIEMRVTAGTRCGSHPSGGR